MLKGTKFQPEISDIQLSSHPAKKQFPDSKVLLTSSGHVEHSGQKMKDRCSVCSFRSRIPAAQWKFMRFRAGFVFFVFIFGAFVFLDAGCVRGAADGEGL